MNQYSAYKDKTVVVTGAASGIGRQTTELLLAAGANVIALDRNPSDLKVEQFISVDFTQPETITAAAKQINGEIDVLLNIAGVPGTVDPEIVVRVNVLGLRMLTDSLIDRIRSGGSVTHVASIAGAQWAAHLDEVQRLLATPDYATGVAWLKDHPMDGKRAYDFSKECVVVMAKQQGHWLRERGVRVNTVSPGPVQTPILKDFRESVGPLLDLVTRETGRDATAIDIARVILFLSDPSLEWLNATDVQVDGGFMSGLVGGWVKLG
ncbi:3-alpha-hydroxysteroid dehydrogenase [Actinomycetes bacterium]|nr:3-alpha-hydroxysteroid dehydrogenase [Actinomycetes bacterium]